MLAATGLSQRPFPQVVVRVQVRIASLPPSGQPKVDEVSFKVGKVSFNEELKA
jgi:hypothetical protein